AARVRGADRDGNSGPAVSTRDCVGFRAQHFAAVPREIRGQGQRQSARVGGVGAVGKIVAAPILGRERGLALAQRGSVKLDNLDTMPMVEQMLLRDRCIGTVAAEDVEFASISDE